MISVEEALSIVLSVKRNYGTELVPLDQSVGRVLREDLKADRPFPPFNRVTMDGIALNYEAFISGQRQFKIEGIAAAGSPQINLQKFENCLEVMTGAVLPTGADTVIRYEDLTIKDGIAQVNLEELKQGKNVHPEGFDRKAGDLLTPAGRLISPAEIGVAATVGKANLKVSTKPKVLIISTGDELVDTSETPQTHQIRKSNVYLLQSLFTKRNIPAEVMHLQDNYEQILNALKDILQKYDVLVLSGGVSMGKFDFLPRAFRDLEVKEHFHKVKQRPGKPLWFGESREGTVIFALPGNPVSSFSCAQKYVMPWLSQAIELPPRPSLKAQLTLDFSFKPDLNYFLQVKVRHTAQGILEATPVTGNGSGDLANLTEADGFLELPRGQELYAAGQVFDFVAYRELVC